MSSPAPVHALKRATGYAPVPWGLDLLLTDGCNMRCTYCPITTDAIVERPSAVMETAKAIAFLESVAYFKPMIRLFGGEPFLHPEWPVIIKTAVTNGLPVTVVTNGTRLRGRGEEVVRSGLLALGISVDPREAHDAYRGKGTFAAAKEVIDEINRAKEKLGSKTPLIEIYTTVYDGTYSKLLDWAAELSTWQIETLRLQHQIWLRTAQRPISEQMIRGAIGECNFFRSDVDTYCSDEMPNVDVKVLFEQLAELETGKYPFGIEFHPPLPPAEMMEFYENPNFRRRTHRACTLISSYAFVDPRGRLYPCLTLDMGNVFERSFEEVWNGRKFRAFRRLLRKEQRLPLCERCPA
ncbi:MAG TPA: radical SAM protein [Thermoanaerobaculia bacterium]|nr:radical SAM protein [Thermoanaerobaculia bacterium]